jgi:hypothetical protein
MKQTFNTPPVMTPCGAHSETKQQTRLRPSWTFHNTTADEAYLSCKWRRRPIFVAGVENGKVLENFVIPAAFDKTRGPPFEGNMNVEKEGDVIK